ncbi:hypothetical protein NDN08_004534 [Rhodosorus marinus]|uniref:Right handed beta helix domain-containing protein n=1 Tax=Rhodosorus marinus TaxID=101924 RepID=A0AAV8ULL7_9RHOD|nr:hypothetical protein NDN08_004534 [Rhodosorus marinus]
MVGLRVWVLVLVGCIFFEGCLGRTIVLTCGNDLKNQVESAKRFDVLVSNGACKWTVGQVIRIAIPLTIKGVHVTLTPGVVIPVFAIFSAGVTISDFTIIGNRNSVTKAESLIKVHKGGFVIENGILKASSSHGVRIAPIAGGDKIDGGIIRDLVGYRNMGNLLFISTTNEGRITTKNILVENLRAYDSKFKGALEVSNGVQDIFVQTIYAERCVFAFGMHDQGGKMHNIRRLFLNNVVARNCGFGIQSRTSIPHFDISISGVIIENCRVALQINNLNWGRLYDVRVIDAGIGRTQIAVLNSDNMTVRDVAFIGTSSNGNAVLIKNSSSVRVSGITLGERTSFGIGMTFFETIKSKFLSADISEINLRAAKVEEIKIVPVRPTGA